MEHIAVLVLASLLPPCRHALGAGLQMDGLQEKFVCDAVIDKHGSCISSLHLKDPARPGNPDLTKPAAARPLMVLLTTGQVDIPPVIDRPLGTVAEGNRSEARALLEETFDKPLSADWHWGLGTWAAKAGVLRAFESGERRHGPVKQRRFAFTEADVHFEFRLEGKASFASFPIDGSPERGHILNIVMGREVFRIIAHPKKGESVDLVREKITLADREWHPVHIVLKGETITVEFNGRTWTAKHPVVAEPKANIGFGGESGGPEGEKAGAIEFRHLKITATP